MTEVGWAQLIGLALGSIVLVKLLDIGCQEVGRYPERRQAAKQF